MRQTRDIIGAGCPESKAVFEEKCRGTLGHRHSDKRGHRSET
jgi:hypothetical protein